LRVKAPNGDFTVWFGQKLAHLAFAIVCAPVRTGKAIGAKKTHSSPSGGEKIA
jgi:hypothetical protein